MAFIDIALNRLEELATYISNLQERSHQDDEYWRLYRYVIDHAPERIGDKHKLDPIAEGVPRMKQEMIESGAEFSEDRIYRYSLWRFWEKEGRYAVFIGLNPSTADETKNDPTVRRCIRYAYDWGHNGLIMLNLFAYRSKSPKYLYSLADPIGPDNDFHLRSASSKAGITIIAWGMHGNLMNRDKAVIPLLKDPHFLALTKHGHPRHPLYLKKNLMPKPFKETRNENHLRI